MVIFWRIRYLDTNEKVFKNRDLFLDSQSLDPTMRAIVELAVEAKTQADKRDFMKYRALFTEDNTESATEKWLQQATEVKSFSLTEYFEDETGKELSVHEMGPILTGEPSTVLVPSGTSAHDLDLIFADPTPLPIAEVSLTPEELKLLGYFARDIRELGDSAFIKDGPGTISAVGSFSSTADGGPVLKTAATDDEVRSFVTIFRRIYMENEPANLRKAVDVFVNAAKDHPYANWVAGEIGEYEGKLGRTPEVRPFVQPEDVSFTRKRIIDVFLYTQYAHQPNKAREKQFNDCLKQLTGRRQLLTWIFFCEVWKCGLAMGNIGRLITAWFGKYCEHHQVTADVLSSIALEIPGIGALEKEDVRKARLLQERSEALAIELWQGNGSPEGGHYQFVEIAKEQIAKLLEHGPTSD